MDEEGAIAKLRLALPVGAKHGFERATSEYMFRRIFTDLCAFALKHGIETVYVKRVIRSQRLYAPSPEISGETQPQTTLQQPNAGKQSDTEPKRSVIALVKNMNGAPRICEREEALTIASWPASTPRFQFHHGHAAQGAAHERLQAQIMVGPDQRTPRPRSAGTIGRTRPDGGPPQARGEACVGLCPT